ANTALSTNFTREERYLVLENGEAFFEVAKDRARPFIVQAGAVRVKAVGTEFNVRRSLGMTFVSVREGVVEVAQEGATPAVPVGEVPTGSIPVRSRDVVTRLRAGQEGVAASAQEVAVLSVPRDNIASWQEGRLEFVDEPMQSVLATVNRYSQQEIILSDPSA